jgi:hypothetical protein
MPFLSTVFCVGLDAAAVSFASHAQAVLAESQEPLSEQGNLKKAALATEKA